MQLSCLLTYNEHGTKLYMTNLHANSDQQKKLISFFF